MSNGLYNSMLVVHIISVAMWLGANIAMGVGSSRAEAASAEVNAWWAETQGFLGRTVKNAAFLVLLITGFGMIARENDAIEFSSPLVAVGTLMVVIGGAFGGMVFAPGCRQIAASFREGDEATAKSTIAKLGGTGAIESVLVIVTIAFMVFQWGN